ncbi:hypothetical protein QP028_05030 [Corynebacterium suedekumii]|nr:hypothetical protein QP028_05030 [Corynebacterium suedekumii]
MLTFRNPRHRGDGVALDTLPAELFSVTLPLGLLFILGARILVRRMSVTHARESTRFRPTWCCARAQRVRLRRGSFRPARKRRPPHRRPDLRRRGAVL